MVKLTNRRIQWLVRQVASGKKTTQQIARTYSITPRRVQQLVKHYRDTDNLPTLDQRRRPRTELTEFQTHLIEEVFQRHRVGARLLKVALDEERPGNRIPKNKIHAYLRKKGYTAPNKRKQRKRKRCRYERKHSGSLVHIDTHYCDWSPEICLMTVLDDASRRVLAAGEVTHVTAQNAIRVLHIAIAEAWRYNLLINQVNSDRGPEFFSNTPGKKSIDHAFPAFLKRNAIRHIPSAAKNPQTNGKLERWHQDYEKHRPRFGSLGEYIAWSNERIHGELRGRPNREFIQKLPAECLLGLLFGGGER